MNQQNKNISLDFDIIWSKINDENRLVDFDMTDTSLIYLTYVYCIKRVFICKYIFILESGYCKFTQTL